MDELPSADVPDEVLGFRDWIDERIRAGQFELTSDDPILDPPSDTLTAAMQEAGVTLQEMEVFRRSMEAEEERRQEENEAATPTTSPETAMGLFISRTRVKADHDYCKAAIDSEAQPSPAHASLESGNEEPRLRVSKKRCRKRAATEVSVTPTVGSTSGDESPTATAATAATGESTSARDPASDLTVAAASESGKKKKRKRDPSTSNKAVAKSRQKKKTKRQNQQDDLNEKRKEGKALLQQIRRKGPAFEFVEFKRREYPENIRKRTHDKRPHKRAPAKTPSERLDRERGVNRGATWRSERRKVFDEQEDEREICFWEDRLPLLRDVCEKIECPDAERHAIIASLVDANDLLESATATLSRLPPRL